MSDGICAHSLAYQALDQVLAHGFVAPSSRRAMFSAVDELRSRAAPQALVRQAECISVELHKLECALRNGDETARGASIEQLRGHAAALLNWRISSRS
jgi:hypothetical protein